MTYMKMIFILLKALLKRAMVFSNSDFDLEKTHFEFEDKLKQGDFILASEPLHSKVDCDDLPSHYFVKYVQLTPYTYDKETEEYDFKIGKVKMNRIPWYKDIMLTEDEIIDELGSMFCGGMWINFRVYSVNNGVSLLYSRYCPGSKYDCYRQLNPNCYYNSSSEDESTNSEDE